MCGAGRANLPPCSSELSLTPTLLSVLTLICKPNPGAVFPYPQPSPRAFDAEGASNSVSSSRTSEQQHLTDFLPWVGIVGAVLHFATEEIFVKCNSEQIASAKFPCVSQRSWTYIQIP